MLAVAASSRAFRAALERICVSDDEQLLGAPSGDQVLVLVEERPDGCLEALVHFVHLLLAGGLSTCLALHSRHASLSNGGCPEAAAHLWRDQHKAVQSSCSPLTRFRSGIKAPPTLVQVLRRADLSCFSPLHTISVTAEEELAAGTTRVQVSNASVDTSSLLWMGVVSGMMQVAVAPTCDRLPHEGDDVVLVGHRQKPAAPEQAD